MKSPQYEQALQRHGVEFAYHESIAIMDIDAVRGLRNQARLLEPMEAELVETYTAACKEGVNFPPLVLHKPGRCKYLPVDGNHRLAAYLKANKTVCDAYVIQCDDQQIVDRLTWTFNNLVNGKRLSRDECLEHAVTFVQKYGYSNSQAAQEWGVPLWQVSRTVQNNKVRDILVINGVKQTKVLTEMILHIIAPLVQVGEDIMVEAAKVVINNGLSEVQTTELVKDVKRARNHDEKAKFIKDFSQSEVAKRQRAETKGGTIKRSSPLPRQQLIRLIAKANRLFEDYPAKEALRPPGAELKKIREDAGDLVHRLITLFGLGALPNREEAAG